MMGIALSGSAASDSATELFFSVGNGLGNRCLLDSNSGSCVLGGVPEAIRGAVGDGLPLFWT